MLTLEEVREIVLKSEDHKRFLKRQKISEKKRNSAQRIADACNIESNWDKKFGSSVQVEQEIQEVQPVEQEVQEEVQPAEEDRETLVIRPCSDYGSPYSYL